MVSGLNDCYVAWVGRKDNIEYRQKTQEKEKARQTD